MKQSIRNMAGILLVLLAGATVQAELQLVANFDGLSGNPDNQACNGVLGGTIDTESDGTGNSSLPTVNGSTVLSVIGHSSGTLARAIGLGGITNTIDNTETGIAFFRFSMATGGTVRPHMGLFAEAGDNPVNGARTQTATAIPVGFKLVDNGTGFDLVTLDGATVLKPGLARSQWYNVWIVADNAADTFDLYLSEAEGPAGDATLPKAQDLLGAAIPFLTATTDPLNSLIFANPVSPTGSGQATRIYVDEIWWDGDQGLSKPTTAKNPTPADNAQDVAQDVILGWTPAPSAIAHNVYLGTSQVDVNAADVANPMGVLAAQGQDANSFDPGLLELGRTYYWRVDEVNSTDQTVFKGSVWSFTVEPLSYPIENVTATASSFSESMGPGTTVDGSGLDDEDRHSVDGEQMWLSGADGPQPAWIQYEFDAVYKLDQLLVWNSNQILESVLGFGARNVTVEYSTDGAAWTALGDIEFARASGTATYAANTTVDFAGVLAKYVRLTIHSNWGGVVAQYGLSEVRFYYLPVLPREPIPAVARTNVAVDAVLSWRAGREAASHQVFFGTDEQAVADGTAPVSTVADNRFDPGALSLGTTYYWKVVEVNEAATPGAWEGDVWTFSTREYLDVDDMEAYNDDDNRIYETWIDGVTTGASGSTVGYFAAPFAERAIVHGGKQSMPLEYNNVSTPFYSEAEQEFAPAQNWTVNGADTLSLYFRGQPTGFQELSADHILMNGVGTDIYSTADQGRFVYKQLSGNGTIIARVDRLDATDPWAKAGVMIRQSLEANSIWALSLFAPGNGFRFQTRPTVGGAGASDTAVVTPAQTAVRAPVWIKLERTGSQFNAYYATVEAPTTWIPSPWNPQTIAMTDPVYVGLAVTSHVATAVTQAEFSSIATTGAVTGNWQSVDLGIAQPAGNRPDTFYVTVKDSAGKSVTVKHPDALATTIGTWQQWQIPFSSLTGIDVAKVKTLILGIGDRAAPQRGAGMLYIDDISFGRPAR